MPRFNTSDSPILQDNYPLIVRRSDTSRPDSSIVGYEPDEPDDWNDGTDPGNVDAALDELAERAVAGAVRTGVINIPQPDGDDEFVAVWFDHDVRILEVYSQIVSGTGTVSFHLYNRARASSGSGTSGITSSAIEATTSGTTTTSFVSDGDVDDGQCLVYKQTAFTSAPTLLRVFYKYRLR